MDSIHTLKHGRLVRGCLLAWLAGLFGATVLAADVPCAAEASAQAKRLLAFHVGDELRERKSFEPPVAVVPLKNPAHPAQVFGVVQVDAHISPRGRYRMRFIFAPPDIGCVLMGQEILELAKL